jgi:hypothetical protein
VKFGLWGQKQRSVIYVKIEFNKPLLGMIKKRLICCVKFENVILKAVLIQVVWSDDVLFGK